MQNDFLPYGRQYIDDDDIAAVAAALKGDLLTGGPLVEEWETRFAEKVGARHAVCCNSGSAALHLATLALGISPGDRVIVPAITFVATASAPAHAGARIAFADVDPETGLLDLNHLESLLKAEPGTRAVYPVDYAGHTPDMKALRSLTDKYGAKVVEDACHAVGSLYEPGKQPVGSCLHSDVTVFSTHPVKTLTTGEGGLATTNDDQLAEAMRRLRNHGMTRDPNRFTQERLAFDETGAANPWYYEVTAPAFNFRLPDICCALGLSQLGKLDRFVQSRRRLADLYDAKLSDLAPALRPLTRSAHSTAAWHLYGVLIDFDAVGLSRAALMGRLRDAGVGSQVHYIPLPFQPCFRDSGNGVTLPGTEAFYARTLSLPLFPTMTEADVDRVVSALCDILA
jgi:UDP-4-amino-4,6-dideoxy-N-acetyl-beta-L-altrosamine transaminase